MKNSINRLLSHKKEGPKKKYTHKKENPKKKAISFSPREAAAVIPLRQLQPLPFSPLSSIPSDQPQTLMFFPIISFPYATLPLHLSLAFSPQLQPPFPSLPSAFLSSDPRPPSPSLSSPSPDQLLLPQPHSFLFISSWDPRPNSFYALCVCACCWVCVWFVFQVALKATHGGREKGRSAQPSAATITFDRRHILPIPPPPQPPQQPCLHGSPTT